MTAFRSQTPPSQPPAASDATVNRLLVAGLLLAAGMVLLADQFHLLPVTRNATVWDWLMLGAGSLLLTAEAVRAVTIRHSRLSTARTILGAAFAGLGLTAIFDISLTVLGPIALLAIGLIILARSIVSNS